MTIQTTLQEPVSRCRRCNIAPLDTNPLINGVCLWCWAQDTGADLGGMVAKSGWDQVLDTLSRTHDDLCTYCSEPAFTPAFIDPPMCTAHYECALLVSRLDRRGTPVTLANLERVHYRCADALIITARDLPGLLEDLMEEQK